MPAMVPNQIVSEHGRLNEGNRGGSEFDQNDLLQRDTCTNYPQYQLQLQHFVAPLMHPLASPSKRLKVLHDDASPHYNEPWSQSSVHHPTLASSPLPLPVNTGSSPLTIDPPVVREQLPTSALARNTASDSSISVENPYSTSRGLRQFSMKVCEKVEEKGTTTYNEVADELVRELRQAEEIINAAAIARGEVQATSKSKKSSKKSSSSDKSKKNHDDKNIRRRVYDALNVLMAMDIITKNKKQITWRGLPGSAANHHDHLGDDSCAGMTDGGVHQLNGLSRRQRMQQLQAETSKRKESIQTKRECLRELMVQSVCFQNLLGRNYANELEQSTQIDSGKISNELQVKEVKSEKIPLPFIVINTDSKAVVQCEMCHERTNVSFDFSQPFEINDDNEILKRLGMNQVSREALQRSLPPDLYHYCNTRGLLQSLIRQR